jgi:hypothetical protein
MLKTQQRLKTKHPFFCWLAHKLDILPRSFANQKRKKLQDFLEIFNLDNKEQKYHIPEFSRKSTQEKVFTNL